MRLSDAASRADSIRLATPAKARLGDTDERRLHRRRALMTPHSDFAVVAAIRLAVLVVPLVVSAVPTPLRGPVDQRPGQPHAEPCPPTVSPSRNCGHGGKLTDLPLADPARPVVE
jgi:hypothetical protein